MEPITDTDSINKHEFKLLPFLRQFYVSSVIWTLYFMLGLSYGALPVSIPQLRKEANSTESVSDEMTSWISAMIGYSAGIWMFGLGFSAHYFGRMKTVLAVAMISFVGFVVLYNSRNATDVLVSQTLQGVVNAAISTVGLLVLTEYSSPQYRGVFLTLKSATLFWGIWVANAIGAFLNFRNIGLLGIACSIYCILSIFIVPESPYWLSVTERYQKCAQSHRWLHGNDMEKDLEILLNTPKTIESERKRVKSMKNYIKETLFNITTPEIYKPITVSFITIFAYYSFGKFVYTVYSIQIIRKITNNESTAYIGMLILDGFTVLGMYFGCGLSKILKRRTLYLSSSAIATFLLYVISVYLYLIKFSLISENNYITIALLTAYSLGVCGPLILSFSIFAEVIPVKSRTSTMCIIAFTNFCCLGTILKVSPYIFKNLGFDGTFLLFAVASTVGIYLIYLYLPETKDKTLHEIANLFKNETTEKTVELKPLTKN